MPAIFLTVVTGIWTGCTYRDAQLGLRHTEKRRPKFEVVDGEDLLEGTDNILRDNTVRFTTRKNTEYYPSEIRRIVYYEPELKRTFTYYTNKFFLKAKEIVFLYKNRWAVEIFFKWMKGRLRIKSFWGNTENALRIWVYVAIVTYCTVAIIEMFPK